MNHPYLDNVIISTFQNKNCLGHFMKFLLDGWNKALSWDEFREILELSF